MHIARRSFLKKALLLMPFGFIKPIKIDAEPLRYRLNRFRIAGFQYYAGPQLVDQLRFGSSLDLVAEPDNRHDYYAVRIEWQGQKLGYVPRSDNRHLSRLLRQGVKLRSQVLEAESNTAPWQMLKVIVELEVG